MTVSACLKCGECAVRERRADLRIERSGREKIFSDWQMFCSSCENVSYEGHQISEHERARADAIRELEGLLSPDELLAIRTKYQLKQTDLEQMLSTGPKTWTRWERGKIPQSKAADTLIRIIATDPGVARWLMLQAGVDNPDADATFRRIELDARALTRAKLQAELGDQPSADLERYADHLADTAFDTVRDAHRQAASRILAA